MKIFSLIFDTGGHWLRMRMCTITLFITWDWTQWVFLVILNCESWSSSKWYWLKFTQTGIFSNLDTKRWGKDGRKLTASFHLLRGFPFKAFLHSTAHTSNAWEALLQVSISGKECMWYFAHLILIFNSWNSLCLDKVWDGRGQRLWSCSKT